MPGYAWGPTTIGQPMCGVDLHIVCKEKPQYMRRYAMFPSGQFAPTRAGRRSGAPAGGAERTAAPPLTAARSVPLRRAARPRRTR